MRSTRPFKCWWLGVMAVLSVLVGCVGNPQPTLSTPQPIVVPATVRTERVIDHDVPRWNYHAQSRELPIPLDAITASPGEAILFAVPVSTYATPEDIFRFYESLLLPQGWQRCTQRCDLSTPTDLDIQAQRVYQFGSYPSRQFIYVMVSSKQVDAYRVYVRPDYCDGPYCERAVVDH
jgi:hypothetical protein